MSSNGETSSEIVTKDELLARSNDIFGQESYGLLAADIIARLRREAFITAIYGVDSWDGTQFVHNTPRVFVTGLTHNPQSGEDITYKEVLKGRAATSASSEDLERIMTELMEDKPLYFDYAFSDNPGQDYIHDPDRTQKAFMVPVSITKSRLAAYMTSRRDHMPVDHESPVYLSDHQSRGSIGRAIDVLLSVSGVKPTVDPEATVLDGELINYNDFRKEYLKYFVTPATRSHFHTNISNAMRWQLSYGKPVSYYPFDVEIEGNVRVIQSKSFIDKISLDSLRKYGALFQKKTVGEVISRL
jgi:hypothetical protein